MHFRSLLSRIVWLHILAIVVAAVAMPLAAYFLLNATATSFENRILREHADLVAKYVTPRRDGGWDINLPPDLRALYTQAFGGFALAVIDGSGQVLYSSLPEGGPVLYEDLRAAQATFFQRPRNKAVYYGANIPEIRGGRTFWIQLSQNIEHPDVIIDDVVADFLRRVGWFTLPIMLFLVLVDIAIVRRALRPVSDASRLARTISPGRIDLRLPSRGLPSEVLPLVEAVNQALDRLERGFRAQREFTADAAHELRTPLAVLRMRVDAVQNTQIARALRADIDAMTRIVNQLLELAELENPLDDLDAAIDIRQVAADVVALVAPMALANGKQIALTGCEDPVWVKGNATLLFQAIRNVADNAVHHTEPGTTVEVEVAEGGEVRVLDEGPGIPHDERAIIFRRFWRRASHQRAGGAGLGLSIVSRIVEAHGASIAVDERPSGGAIFVFRFVEAVREGRDAPRRETPSPLEAAPAVVHAGNIAGA